MTRPIDADALLERMKKDPLFPLVEEYGISGVIKAEPTVEAIPVEFIKSEIKENKGFYNSNLRRLLDEWAERKEE